MTGTIVVDATDEHGEGITTVARAHGFAGVDTAVRPAYRRFVASHGRLVVALERGLVVGFGGAIDVGDARLVTDLFLLVEHQGQGLGGAMLRSLVDDTARRLTFSSAHERATPSYARMGMLPIWTLHYWTGSAPEVAATQRVSQVSRDDWQGDRPDLADFWSANDGWLVHIVDDSGLVGWAIVVPSGNDGPWSIARLVSDLPHDQVMLGALSVVPSGQAVQICVPDRSTAGPLLKRLGFQVTDQDICCATEGVDVSTRVAALHPGLG